AVARHIGRENSREPSLYPLTGHVASTKHQVSTYGQACERPWQTLTRRSSAMAANKLDYRRRHQGNHWDSRCLMRLDAFTSTGWERHGEIPKARIPLSVERVEWEGRPRSCSPRPILMSHTIVGRSLFDQTQDLQQVSSVLMRDLLDNLYLSNRPRPEGATRGQSDLNLAGLAEAAPAVAAGSPERRASPEPVVRRWPGTDATRG